MTMTQLPASRPRHAPLLGVATALVLAASAFGAGAQALRDDTLYRELGAQPGLVRLVDDFMLRLLADARMNPFFAETDQKVFKSQLVAQFCEVAGGPCRLKGKDMKTVHSSQDITKSNFNALVEVLQASMDAQGLPFAAQNRLLARLAPMHREIVNAP